MNAVRRLCVSLGVALAELWGRKGRGAKSGQLRRVGGRQEARLEWEAPDPSMASARRVAPRTHGVPSNCPGQSGHLSIGGLPHMSFAPAGLWGSEGGYETPAGAAALPGIPGRRLAV